MDPLWPDLSPGVQAFARAGYGTLLLLTLLQALPEARRFFMSERWGGYARSSRGVDVIQNPYVMPVVMALWMALAMAIAFGWWSPWPALLNAIICRYFFIHMRWKGVLRGMGAPGFVSYWLGTAVLLLEYTSRFAPDLRSLALLVIQVDFALIMMSAGVYKATAGYLRNNGMELGLCNPMWGYWWRAYLKLPPSHWLLWGLNQLAWGTEVVGATLLLLPLTREWGGLIISISFMFILTHIRLGFLCEMLVLAGLLGAVPGGMVDRVVGGLVAPAVPATGEIGARIGLANLVLGAALWTYLLLLPLAHLGLSVNFYAERSLPSPLQRALERYTNLFGIIVWRVFSVNLINFFVEVCHEEPGTGRRTRVSRFGTWPRFNHVGEMICLTSLFTTLKYYPGNEAIFRERIVRYARTVPRPEGHLVVFEYYGARKLPDRFEWVRVAEYRVDVAAATVDEVMVDGSFDPRAAHADSRVHEAAMPGTYAPARR